MAKASAKKTEKTVEELSYEEALTELEGIVESLEDGQNPLEESLNLLNGGRPWSRIAAHCLSRLNSKCKNWLESRSFRSRKNPNELSCHFRK
jgi:exodeoxyribonuclease VII small subunit